MRRCLEELRRSARRQVALKGAPPFFSRRKFRMHASPIPGLGYLHFTRVDHARLTRFSSKRIKEWSKKPALVSPCENNVVVFEARDSPDFAGATYQHGAYAYMRVASPSLRQLTLKTMELLPNKFPTRVRPGHLPLIL
ncbi:unnamed protein product, partial [Iphiclides podalirius]